MDVLLNEYIRKIGLSLDQLKRKIEDVLKPILKIKVEGRVKEISKIKRKMAFYGIDSIFLLEDIYAISIFVSEKSQAYLVQKELSRHFECEFHHNFLDKPKTRPEAVDKNIGFRALQLILKLNGCMVDVQITTPEFHEYNESVHERYLRRKYKK